MFQKMRYMYEGEEKKRFEMTRFPVDWTFGQYMQWKGYQEEEEVKVAERKYGKNRLLIRKFVGLGC